MTLASPGTIDSTLYLLLGILSVVLIGVALLRRAQLRGVTLREATRAQRTSQREQHDVQRSLAELLKQLDEASRRIDSQIETQLAKLQAAINAADQRVALLNAKLGATGAADADPATRRRRVYELADSGTVPISIAETLCMPLGDVEVLLNLRRFERNSVRRTS
jgi:septal ring factor EnvC (AmiA/AmiB activator)